MSLSLFWSALGVLAFDLALYLFLLPRVGLLWLLAQMAAAALLGAWCVTRGRRARLLRPGVLIEDPAELIFEGFFDLLAGVALVVPGLASDAVGLFLLLPQGRRWIRRLYGGGPGIAPQPGPEDEPPEPREDLARRAQREQLRRDLDRRQGPPRDVEFEVLEGPSDKP